MNLREIHLKEVRIGATTHPRKAQAAPAIGEIDRTRTSDARTAIVLAIQRTNAEASSFTVRTVNAEAMMKTIVGQDRPMNEPLT